MFENSFTPTQCSQLMNTFMNLVFINSVEDEEYDHDVKPTIIKGICENQLRKHFLVYSNNPIKICVLIMDLSEILAKRNTFVRKAVKTVRRLYSQAARDLLWEWRQDYSKIESCVHDVTYCGEVVMDMISRHEIIEILRFKKMALIIAGMWQGKYEMQSFLNYSLNFKIISNIVLKQNLLVGYSPDFSEEMDFGFLWAKAKEEYWMWKYRQTEMGGKSRWIELRVAYKKPIKGHFFMFKTWRRSMSVRYMIDAICIIIMGVILQYAMAKFVDDTKDWYALSPELNTKQAAFQSASTSDPNYSTIKSEFEEIEAKVLQVSDNNYANFRLILTLFAIFTTYTLRNCFQIIFACKRKRNWSSLYGDFILSLIQLVYTILAISRYYIEFSHLRRESDPRYDTTEILTAAFEGDEVYDMWWIFGFFIMLQWTRILFLFKLNSFVSPMLSIMKNMMKDILKFCLIYLLILCIFWASGRLLFSRTPGFDSDINAALTLFSTTFGSFSYGQFESSRNELSSVHGDWFLMTYMVIGNIVLLNFVIAIISNTYSRLTEISQSLYLNEVIKARNIFEYDKYYSGLISLPPPLNILLLPISPFLIFLKSKKLNNIILHISYLPVMITGTLVFMLTSFLLYPFSYLALLYQNFIDIWEKGNNGSSKWIEASQFFAMIFKAPFILLGGIFLDSAKFIKSLYTSKIKIYNEKAAGKRFDFGKLECNSFMVLKKIMLKKKGKLVDIKRLLRELNEEFDIYKHLRTIIYSSHSNIPTHLDKPSEEDHNTDSDCEVEGSMNRKGDTKHLTSLDIIKQYNYCKRFIVSNSIPLELHHQTKRQESLRPSERNTEVPEDEGSVYADREIFTFPLTLNQFIKKQQTKRKRVLDTSSVLKMIEEIEENVYFKHIINCNYISVDMNCWKRKYREKHKIFEKTKRDVVNSYRGGDLKNCMVIQSDYEILESRILNSKVDIKKRLPLCNVQANYDAMEANLERQLKS